MARLFDGPSLVCGGGLPLGRTPERSGARAARPRVVRLVATHIDASAPTLGPSWRSRKPAIRYRAKVREVIRLLTAELKREIRRAERSIREGEGIRSVVSLDNPRLSPLGAYVVAHRAGRSDLAELVQPAAASQQRSCPLYKTASLAFIPAEYVLAETFVDRSPM